MCLAVKVDDGPTGIWVPKRFYNLMIHYKDGAPDWQFDLPYMSEGHLSTFLHKTIQEADIIEAHNAGFERAIWEHVCVNR